MKNFSKKDLNKVPKWFLQKMSQNEKRKWLHKHLDFLNNNNIIDAKHDIEFNPDTISNETLLKGMTDAVCSLLSIENFELPKEIESFIEKNRKFLYY